MSLWIFLYLGNASWSSLTHMLVVTVSLIRREQRENAWIYITHRTRAHSRHLSRGSLQTGHGPETPSCWASQADTCSLYMLYMTQAPPGVIVDPYLLLLFFLLFHIAYWVIHSFINRVLRVYYSQKLKKAFISLNCVWNHSHINLSLILFFLYPWINLIDFYQSIK